MDWRLLHAARFGPSVGPRAAPPVTTLLWAPGMPATAQVLHVGSLMACSASRPAVNQKRPKEASTACHASSMRV